MSRKRSFLSRLWGFLGGGPADRELEEELEFHLEMETGENLRRGMRPEEARRAALRRLGGLEQVKERYRDQRSLPLLENLLQDLKFAATSLIRNPGFTLIVVLIFALGIGANAAIFSVVHSVLITDLPYPEPDRLVQVHNVYRGYEASHTGLSLRFLEEQVDFMELAGTGQSSGVNLSHRGSAVFVRSRPVTTGYFAVLGIEPQLGRGFRPEDELKGATPVVVISHQLWRDQFESTPDILGETVRLGDVSHLVVGVMPADFFVIPPSDIWVPLQVQVSPQGTGTNFPVLARLHEGISLQVAAFRLEQLADRFRELYPGVNFTTFRPERYQQYLSDGIRTPLVLLLGAVLAVLLIACANISGLLMARAASRNKEVATRVALGGGQSRIMRQFVLESLLLGLAGGLLGVLAARMTLDLVTSLAPAGMFLWRTPEMNSTVLAAMLFLAAICGVVSGLLPARQAARVEVSEVLQEASSRGASAATNTRFRSALVVAQIAVSVVLLIGAGLLVRTFVNLRTVNVGFDPSNLVAAQMSMQGQRYASTTALAQFFEESIDRLTALPGVRTAAVANNVPVQRGLNLPIQAEGEEGRVVQAVDWRYVSPGYFETLGMELLQGRFLNQTDTAGSLPVAVVDQEFVRRFFPDGSPLGKTVYHHPMGDIADRDRQVVGVVPSIVSGGLGGQPQPTIYVSVRQVPDSLLRLVHGYFPTTFLLRTDDRGISFSLVRDAIASADAEQPISDFRTMDQVMMGTIQRERFQMVLISFFAVLALVMALAGVYGLIAYSVARRTREMGIRLALGATGKRVVALMLGRGLLLAGIGVAVGIAGAFGLTRFLQSLLFGVESLDLATFAGVGLLILLATALAGLIPSLRLLRLDPTVALREE